MKAGILFLASLAAACTGRGGGDDAAGLNERGGSNAVGRPPIQSVQTTDLTGLYEARQGGSERARMCIVATSGKVAFALATEAPGGGSCAGAGEAQRTGGMIRLTMAGDRPCVIDARAAGTAVTFPATVAPGCAYYCAPGTSLAGEMFEKIGGTADDAMRATDLAGDPLCG